MRVLGINALYHDPAAPLVVDGEIAAAEEERFSRRKHGERPVPFAAWELPEQFAAWCLAEAGPSTAYLDAVSYSYHPALTRPADELGLGGPDPAGGTPHLPLAGHRRRGAPGPARRRRGGRRRAAAAARPGAGRAVAGWPATGSGPAGSLEHDAPRGQVPYTRHPLAGRRDVLLVHVTHFNALMWDSGVAPTAVVEHGSSTRVAVLRAGWIGSWPTGTGCSRR